MPTGFNYSRAKSRVDAALARAGMTAYLKAATQTGSDYDPDEGSEKRTPVKIVQLQYTQREIDQARVRRTDIRVLMAKGKLTKDPTPDDILEINGKDYQIIGPSTGLGVIVIAPAGEAIMYELQCRL